MAQQTSLFLVFAAPLLTLLLMRLLATRTTRRRPAGHHHHGRRSPPSPPGQLPIIGHLHLVGSHPHVSLRDLAATHGGADGMVLLRLGQVPTLVVSSPRAAQEVLRARDHALASRPPSVLADILLSGSSDVALAPYGDYWRQARKLVTLHLLSARKVQSPSLRRAREEEAALVVSRLREAAAARATVDVGDLLGAFANDVVCRAVSGRLFRHRGRNRLFRELIEGNAQILAGFNILDYFPSLAKVDVLTRLLCARATTWKKRWDVVLDEVIDEHADTADAGAANKIADAAAHRLGAAEQDDDRDFIEVLLSLQHEYSFTRDQVKAILMDMFAAGTDTSAITLEYAMVELIRNPHLMTKLQEEITSNTPKGQEMVKEANLDDMPYLKAVVKETLRLHPPAPLLLPRIAMETCDVNGYTVEAGTRVIVNAWALGRDASAWEKADEFMPERFFVVDNLKAAAGRDFKLLPFGAGRRVCPGMNFGMATVEIMLANLLYCFGWELPAGMKKEDVDMTEVFGLTVRPKEKLLLCPKLV